MKVILTLLTVFVSAGLAMADPPAAGQTVKVTPLGTHAGEYCALDRAILFEDPTGVRILYDPGRTTWEGDPRLGTIHVVLLSHLHADHLGEVRPADPQTGTCAAPATVSAMPDSTTARIVGAKGAMFVAGGEMSVFMTAKVASFLGVAPSAVPACLTTGLDNLSMLPTGACTAVLRPGGSRVVRLQGDQTSPGVRLATVTAIHTNGIPAAFLVGLPVGTTGYVGDATGFVIQFSNGLTMYLTGDSGITSDMETVVRRYYGASVVVANLSTFFGIGPKEAAFVVNDLVKPRTVIPSHASEAATSGGQLLSDTRTARFVELMRGSSTQVILPLSGVTFELGADGRCVGCSP